MRSRGRGCCPPRTTALLLIVILGMAVAGRVVTARSQAAAVQATAVVSSPEPVDLAAAAKQPGAQGDVLDENKSLESMLHWCADRPMPTPAYGGNAHGRCCAYHYT